METLAEVESVGIVTGVAAVEVDGTTFLGSGQIDESVQHCAGVPLGALVRERREVVNIEDPSPREEFGESEPGGDREGRIDQPGRDGVHPDLRCQRNGEQTGDVIQGRFRGRVGNGRALRPNAGVSADIDDAPGLTWVPIIRGIELNCPAEHPMSGVVAGG
jgi:hypothetical protein